MVKKLRVKTPNLLILHKSNPKKVKQNLKLEDYFKKEMSKTERNEAILKAYQDGFMQSEIAKYLELTGAGVSKILKKLRVATLSPLIFGIYHDSSKPTILISKITSYN